VEKIQEEMDRRRPGQSRITTNRIETDTVDILSGIYEGLTTGAPICMVVWNKDADPTSYEKLKLKPRPGHADYSAHIKYGGYNDPRGGGRFSGRITAGFVMAGSVAKQLLNKILGVEVMAYTTSIGDIKAPTVSLDDIRKVTESNPVRCPHTETAKKMMKLIESTSSLGDSLGGSVECAAINVPSGLGEPIFENLDGILANALFAIPAVKAVEFGAGVNFSIMMGSESNDQIILRNGKVVTRTNFQGGILGGISNGMPIILRVTIKPTPSISKTQETVDLIDMIETTINIDGRHDPCIVPRAVPIVEAMVAIVLVDNAIRNGLIKKIYEVKK
jgi:chorismate synthase